MTETNSTTDVIVIGAGMAGLTAAGELAKAGSVLDRGRQGQSTWRADGDENRQRRPL